MRSLTLFLAWILTVTQALAQGTIRLAPADDVVSIVNAHQANTTYVFAKGTYRLRTWIQPHDHDSYICPDRPCILSGARVLSSVTHSPTYGYWYVGGQTQKGYSVYDASKCEHEWEGCYLPEDLFFTDHSGNVTVKRRLATASLPSLPELRSGTWYFDYAGQTIYFKDDPTGYVIETSVSEAAFRVWDQSQQGGSKANTVIIQNLVMEKFANGLTKGALGCCSTGDGDPTYAHNWTIRGNEIRYNHSTGVKAIIGWQILNNYVHDNGTLGIAANPGSVSGRSNILIQGNEIANNNRDNHTDPSWGAGGVKSTKSLGLVYRNNYVHDNYGAGLWSDISNRGTLYDGNTVVNNTGSGIHHEISYDAVIRNNTLQGNYYTHRVETAGGWGANLFISNSSNVQAYCNTVEVSATGGNAILVLASNRGVDSEPPHSYYVSSGNAVHHNTVVWNGYESYPGWVGAVQYDATNEPSLLEVNSFDHNQYHLSAKGVKAYAFLWSRSNTRGSFASFQAAGQDRYGTIDATDSNSVPAAVIVSPIDGSTLSGVEQVHATAADPSNNIVKMELYVDWRLQSTLNGASPFTFHLDQTSLPVGPHVLAVMAYNSRGVGACHAITTTVTAAVLNPASDGSGVTRRSSADGSQ
jgi:parallel beta-helix repeat protein